MISDISSVIFTAIFLLPGVITNDTIRRVTPLNEESDSRYIFHCLIYSAFNIAVSGKICFSVILSRKESWDAFIIAGLIAIGISLLLGLSIGIILQSKIVEKIVSVIPFVKKKINILTLEPSAWDYAMHRPEGSYVKVMLSDGTVIHGKYANKSMAGDNHHKDLYLENVYNLCNNSGEWKENMNIEGIYIAENQISRIEIIKGAE